MSYSLDDQANVTISGNTTLTELSDGSHSLTVYVKDQFENVGSSSIVYFTIDTVLPEILILSPENKLYTTDIPLNFTVNEPASWVGYSVDGQNNVTITGNTTLTGLSEGSHGLTVYARDKAGNMGASETIYFTITQQTNPHPAQSEPFSTHWILAAIVISVIGLAAVIQVFLRKIKKTNGKADLIKACAVSV
jgi:hypothetical protein